MAHGRRCVRRAPLRFTLLLLALWSGHHRHAFAHATLNPPIEFERSGQDSDNTPAFFPSPAPAPPGGGACEDRVGRVVLELATLSHEKGWALAPRDGGRYLLTTGTSKAAANQAGDVQQDRDGECGRKDDATARRQRHIHPYYRSALYPCCHTMPSVHEDSWPPLAIHPLPSLFRYVC